jgi:carbamoyl-phosphate synthase large subunit
LYNGKVRSVQVNLGKANFSSKSLPAAFDKERIIDEPIHIGGKDYHITCVSIGNPHCIVFCDRVDDMDLNVVGPLFENDSHFPERINADFARVVNRRMIKLRNWERGNGEAWSSGTGAAAAAVAAVENGYCDKEKDITVKLKGGDLIVNYTDDGVFLTGNANLIYEGVVEY